MHLTLLMCESCMMKLHMTSYWFMLALLRNCSVIVNSSQEAPISVTLIKLDKMSYVKECCNSCSLTNFDGVE